MEKGIIVANPVKMEEQHGKKRDGKHQKAFFKVARPKNKQDKKHNLIDIIITTICAVICGADSWVEIGIFGNGKIEWLRTFLELPIYHSSNCDSKLRNASTTWGSKCLSDSSWM